MPSVGPRAANLSQVARVAVLAAPPHDSIEQVASFLSCYPLETVWMVGTPNDAQCARTLDATGTFEVRLVDTLGDPGGAVGDLVGALISSEKQVVAFDVEGDDDTRRAIQAATGYAAIPFLSRRADGEIYFARQTPITPSGLLGALRFTLTKRTKNRYVSDFDLDVRERGFYTLVKPLSSDDLGETFGMTALLRTLLTDDQLARRSDQASACADLLEQRGHPELATAFRQLITHWVEQRLWDANFVPEMVLHNAAHAAAVDRNIASLWEPLREAKKLDELDLTILAAAAWLHDWGHASAYGSGELPTHPFDVRNYHGLLTAIRLEEPQEQSRHALKNLVMHDFCHEVYEGDPSRFTKDVALLCAHHQGWTSSDLELPDPKPTVSQKFDVWTTPKNSSMRGFRLRTFQENYEYCVADRAAYFTLRARVGERLLGEASPSRTSPPEPGGGPRFNTDEQLKRDKELDARRARLRLALLRVADAADIGVHRVPDYFSQQAMRNSIADDYLDRQIELTKAGLKNYVDAPDIYRESMERVKTIFHAVRQEHSQPPTGEDTLTEESVVAAFDRRLNAADVLNGGSPSESASRPHLDFILEIARNAYAYAKHVAAQVVFYKDHDSVRAAVPVLSEDDYGQLQLVVHVLPNQVAPETALTMVRDVIAREWGYTVTDNGTEMASGDLFKQQIGNYLGELGVRLFHIEGALINLGEVTSGLPNVALIDLEAPLPLELSSVCSWPVASGGWVIGGHDGILVGQRDPSAGTRSIGSSIRGDRVGVLKDPLRLQLWNPDGVGLVVTKHVVGLQEAIDVLAVGEGSTVLFSVPGGAAAYDWETRSCVARIPAPHGRTFVQGFSTPTGWLLVDNTGAGHGSQAEICAASQVAGIDVLVRDSDTWIVTRSATDNALRVTRLTKTLSATLPPVPLDEGLTPKHFGWERASERPSSLVLVVVDQRGNTHHFPVLGDGSGWSD